MEFSPKHRKVNHGKCCVPLCNASKKKNTNLSFHKIPKSGQYTLTRTNVFGNSEVIDQRDEWARILNITLTDRTQFVCSQHFKAEDYVLPYVHAKKRFLKKNVIPVDFVVKDELLEVENMTCNTEVNMEQGNQNFENSTTYDSQPETEFYIKSELLSDTEMEEERSTSRKSAQDFVTPANNVDTNTAIDSNLEIKEEGQNLVEETINSNEDKSASYSEFDSHEIKIEEIDIKMEPLPDEYEQEEQSDLEENEDDEEYTKKTQYKCGECKKTFGNVSNLKKHLRIHSGEKPFKCGDCGKAFSDPSSHRNHLRTHTGDRPFKCGQCEKTFSFSASLKAHLVTHTGERPHACTQCDKAFSQAPALKEHMRIHSGEKPYACKECPKTFRSSNLLRRHRLVHRGDKPFKCEICKTTFKASKYLSVHMRSHNEVIQHKCELCDKIFNKTDLLHAHMKIAHGCELPYRCTVCTQTFSRLSNFNIHMKFHNDPYTCSQCNKVFMSSSGLRRHEMSHSRNEKPFTCSECKEEFTQVESLKEHMTGVHNVYTLPYNCTMCSKTCSPMGHFQTEAKIYNEPCNSTQDDKSLNLEFRSSGSKVYKCTVCEITFSHVGYFNRHMLIHADENVYKDIKYENAFTQLEYLKEHETCDNRHMSTHTDEKVFKCTECENVFEDVDSLNGHMTTHISESNETAFSHVNNFNKNTMIHTEEKLHCTECQMTFSQIEGLREHMTIIHNSYEQYKCTICEMTFTDLSYFNMHRATHDEKLYQCSEYEVFRDTNLVQNHMIIPKQEPS